MNLPTRHICLVILLGVLIGHTGVAVHAASHVSGDSGECGFCMAYGDSAEPTEAAQMHGVLDGGSLHWSGIPVAAPETDYVLPFYPRGPPSID